MTAQSKTYTPPNEWPDEYRPVSRESGFFTSSPKKRGKRSLDDMLSEMTSPIEEVAYAIGRIDKIELSIKTIVDALSNKAKHLLIQRKPSLRKYL
jgi:hypothetical protein